MYSATILEKGQHVDRNSTPLKKHTSNLPNWLYILSFAPACPNPFRSPIDFISHPYILSVLGLITAILAGVALPAMDYIFGYWTNGIGNGGSAGREASPSDIIARGSQAGWITTIFGVVYIASFAIFVICCERLLVTRTGIHY